jgi:hypothetical protein
MSDLGDPQDQAEALDADVLADQDDSFDPASYDEPERGFPPEHFLGARAYGVTAAEERVDEPLEERTRHELPDPLDEIEEPDADALWEIEDEELIGADEDVIDDLGDDDSDVDEERAKERPIGRLIGPGGDDDAVDAEDDEPDAVAWRADDDDDSDLSAEEEAVHLTDDPPYGERGDGYIELDE